MEQNNSLDFTNNGNIIDDLDKKVIPANIVDDLYKIIVPGVGVMTVEEAKSLITPGKIPGSNIEFSDDYSSEKLAEFRDTMKKYEGLFSETDKRTFVGFAEEISKRLLVKKALEDLEKKTEETLH